MAEYEVGYGKPPKHSQFKKGTSGNPRGRRKGSKNFVTIMYEELTRPVPVVENNKRTKIPKIRAAFRQAVNKAMMAEFKGLEQMLRASAALERLSTRGNSNRHIAQVHDGMSEKEAAEAFLRQVRGLGPDDD